MTPITAESSTASSTASLGSPAAAGRSLIARPRGGLGARTHRRWPRLLACGLLMAGLAAMLPAQAQPERASREREALRRAQQALRDAQAENAMLQQARSALTAEKDTIAADKARAEAELSRSRARAAQLDAARQQVERVQGEMAELRAQRDTALARIEDLQAQLQASKSTVASLRALLERATATQALLEQRNRALYDVGLAAIELYRSRDAAATWARREPLLGLGQVKVENAAEALRDRLEAARHLTPQASSPDGAMPPAAVHSGPLP